MKFSARVVLGFLLVGLSQSVTARADPSITLQDDRHRTIVLPSKPVRIISLAAHLTDIAVEVGLKRQLVAVDSHSAYRRSDLVRLSAYPEPSIENLARLKPDLVFLWGAGLKPSVVSRLEALGVKVFVSEPQTLFDIITTYELFLKLSSDPPAGASERIANYKKLLQPKVFAKFVPVFTQVWSEPLMTIGRKTFIASALEHCGAELVLAPFNQSSAVINPEAVVVSAAKVILSSDTAQARTYWAQRAASKVPEWSFIAMPQATLSQPSTKLLDALPVLCERLDSLR
jgi:iron complex transport system substrate-binding protein